MEIECQECKKIFKVTFKNRKRKFCSLICASNSKVIPVKCKVCDNLIKSSCGRRTCSDICSKELKIIRNKEAGIKRKGSPGNRKGKTPWNKGLTKDTDERLRKASESIRQGFVDHPNRRLGRKHSKETLAKLRANSGGLRIGAGRGKGGWYKGYWCDSTYELVWLVYKLDNDEHPVRNTVGYPYEWEGKLHRYYPDFILNDVIYEIKGYQTLKDFEKYKAVKDNKLIVLLKKDLQLEFSYVQRTYEYKSLADLYDKSKFKNEDVYLPSHKDLCICGNTKSKKSCTCSKCYKPVTKIEWPELDTLKEIISKSGYAQAGRLFGVSDNTIRKHIKRRSKVM